jgi:hypothetical protein
MGKSLSKEMISEIMNNLGQSNIVNLDVKISDLLEAVRKSGIIKEDDGGDTDLHIVCCNEYGLVTK